MYLCFYLFFVFKKTYDCHRLSLQWFTTVHVSKYNFNFMFLKHTHWFKSLNKHHTTSGCDNFYSEGVCNELKTLILEKCGHELNTIIAASFRRWNINTSNRSTSILNFSILKLYKLWRKCTFSPAFSFLHTFNNCSLRTISVAFVR